MSTTTKLIRNVSSMTRNLGLDLLNPQQRKFEFTRKWLRFGVDWEQYHFRAKPVSFFELYPQAHKLDVSLDFHEMLSGLPLLELLYITTLAKIRQPKRIFEFGTYQGTTTLHLAQACPESEIFTLDLADLFPPTAERPQGGRRYRGTPQEAQVHELFGDSRTFDYAPYYGTMDLIFIDACHEYEYVYSDTQAALRLLAKGGIIVWDDYTWPGVKQTVEDLLGQYQICHIKDTRLAIVDTSLLAS